VRTATPRRCRPLLAAAFVVLVALVSIDCLNLIQSEAWTDLSQAPHMAAVHRAHETGGRQTHDPGSARFSAAVVPSPIDTAVVAEVWIVAEQPASVHTSGLGRRERVRAPPASPVRPGTS
jgi:hypothetical protein